MKAKNVISFLLVVVLIAAFAYIAADDVKIGKFHVPSTFDKEKGIRQGLDLVGGSVIVFEPDVDDLSEVSSSQMDAAEEVIRRRLDIMGHTEATVSRQGDTGIRIEIPNVDNPQEAVKVIGSTAKLEFLDADGNLVMDARGNVESAKAQYGQISEYGSNEHYVQITFTSAGREKFSQATAAAVNAGAGKNIISIALDGEIQMSPTVKDVINEDTCILSGGYSQKEAKDVAALITSGQLPFSLKEIEVRSIGPTLGEKALNTSLTAALIGIILVMLFMIAIYRLPGLVASVSLVAYVSVVTLVLAGFFVDEWRVVTLTLPGIAGVILSIGMAVDANVVIFERIKDELRAGKSVGASVNSGFKRALTAIIDSNITTVIAAAVLYYFGTGPIKSFAMTLFIGIVISMLTAVTLTKFLLKQIVGFGIKNPALYGLSKGGKKND
ncbi:MAG: protein translocase subunit SecD [Ruminococcaceae bacterium]|nr:protein translocase subunit SecD [Oscillospiraceae bacterium]